MTTQEIKTLIAGVDPKAKRYKSTRQGNYTVWGEYRRIQPDGETIDGYGWMFEIDRYTKDDDDPVAAAIEEALIADDRVSYTYDVYYEIDTGYIRHVFDCRGI